MIRKFGITNYKNFKDTLMVDFTKVGGYKFNEDCIANGYIGKAIMYGRNATGKTHLGEAIVDIVDVLRGSSKGIRFISGVPEGILNADSKDEYATFFYEIQLNEDLIVYEYGKDRLGNIIKERLFINNDAIYTIDRSNNQYEFSRLDAVGAETIQLDKYLAMIQDDSKIDMEEELSGDIPFIRYLLYNSALLDTSVLVRFEKFVSGMRKYTVSDQQYSRRRPPLNQYFTEFLSRNNNLKDFEMFLNTMGVECKLQLKEIAEDQKELYFVHNRLIPFFRTASSGTLSLVDFYRRFVISMSTTSFIYMDEFDAFYHYEMAEGIVEYLKKRYPDIQIILTTHNTNLMTNHIMRPDCLFILSQKGTLTALCDATERELREGHNLEKMYIAGEFEKYE